MTSAHIYLIYQNKIKKLNWRKNLHCEDFAYLIKSLYGLQGKILGFQGSDGTIYELSYLLKNKEHISSTPYQVLVKPEPQQRKSFRHLVELKSLKGFEETFEKLPKSSMILLAAFTEADKNFEDTLERLEAFAEEYAEDGCKFFWILMSLNDRNIAKRTFTLSAPLLGFYTGAQKFLEMPINEIGLNNVAKLLDRVHQEQDNSVFNIDQSERSTVSINSIYIIDETNNTNKDADDGSMSQSTYVLDSKSMSTYELKSDHSDTDRQSAATFDIEDRDNKELERNVVQESTAETKNPVESQFEYPPSQGLDFKKKPVLESKGSYFLSKKVSIPPNIEQNHKEQPNEPNELPPNEVIVDEEDTGGLSPSKYTDFYSLLHDNVGKFEPEDYGMAMCLYKEKNKELFDLLNDCRMLNDKDLNSFLVSSFAKKKFALWLIDHFSRENIEKIAQEKTIKNSGVYTAYQCFKYDNDLEDLKGMLEKALDKEEKDKGMRKPTDSIVENEYSDFIKGEDFKRYNYDNLPVIKEGSSKDEESPMIPMDYPGVGRSEMKANEKKYKEMIMAMKDTEEAPEENKGGFNLVLVGSHSNGSSAKPSGRGKKDLTIEFSKNEHPLAREVLEKFFDKEEMVKNIDAFHKLKSKIKWNAREQEQIQHLFDQRDPAFLHVVNRFKSDESLLASLEAEIRDIINVNSIAISSSPRSIKKVQIFNLFKSSLEDFYRDHRMNSTQVKLCLYLFMKIDMSILSAFEVFQLTKDKEDFLDSLNLIYKINYVKLEQQLDDIEEYDDITETQLKIVYAFQADLELAERSTLETVVRAQDRSLMQLHDAYRKTKNKPEFIKKVKELCALKNKQLKEFQNMKEQSENAKEELKNKRKNLIETCKIHRFLKEIPNTQIILDAIDHDDTVMESICSVYELTLDKQDFTESVKVFYLLRTRDKVLELIRDIVNEKQWTELDFKIISDAIESGNKVIMGAYQLYDETKDNDDRLELIDTIEKFIKMQKNK